MDGAPNSFSMPRWRPALWLAQTREPVPQAVAEALVGRLFGGVGGFCNGVASAILVSGFAAARLSGPAVRLWFLAEVVLGLARVATVIAGRRAADWRGVTPTDLYIVLGVAWALSLGLGTALCLASGDWPVAIVAAISATGMAGGACLRNFATPRLAAAMSGLALAPVCAAAAASGETVLWLTAAQIPLYVLMMSGHAFHLRGVVVRTMVAERESGHRARHDDLTGLANRAGLEEAAARLPRDAPSCLLYLDLDGFKAVNDGHGHAAGDALLRWIAGRIAAETAPVETAARIGGDEFAVLCPGRGRAEAIVLAERLIAAAGEAYAFGDAALRVGISVGIALAPEHGRDLAGLLPAADAALYRSKAIGRNRWTLAAPPRGADGDGRLGDDG